MTYVFMVTLDWDETERVTTLQKIQDRIAEGPWHLEGCSNIKVSKGLRRIPTKGEAT